MNKKAPLALLSVLLVAFLVFAKIMLSDTDIEKENVMVDSFDLPEAPELQSVEFNNDAPLYYFLFTHTEDPFNHELSEQRYWRVGEMLENLAAEYPTLALTWTIEFMGADANTIADRNSETGLIDYLKDLRSQGLVDFGYHAHHDPTYMNRPQNDLPKNPSFDEAYEALYTWVTCKKDLLAGGCIQDDGGGLLAIEDNFDVVSMVTGLGISSGALFERSAGSKVIKELLPDRWVGFGFTDHGPANTVQGYDEAVNRLMAILSPTQDTSTYSFWMDNAIRLNDGGINTIDGPTKTEKVVDGVDRNRPQLLNVGIASKYHYTVTGTSPTKWGYAHTDSPELPENMLLSAQQIESKYQLTEQAMTYLMDWLSEDETGSAFVDSEEVLNLFTTQDYWEVNEDELYNIALWLLNNWEEQTPNWTYDGEDYYSLTDAFVLLAHGLNGTFEESDVVSQYYGPWSLKQASSQESTVAVDELLQWVNSWDEEIIAEEFKIAGESFTPSQVLYALAYSYALDYNGLSMERIEIPKMTTAPESYDHLETLGCLGCLDSSWSLKPARFQEYGTESSGASGSSGNEGGKKDFDSDNKDDNKFENSDKPEKFDKFNRFDKNAATSDDVYILYTLNTQEFMTPDLSYETVNRVLDLHEEYEVPIDVYFADFVVQELADDYPDIFTRLQDSDLAAVSYHVRAPFPYGGNYTSYDWNDYSVDELYDLFKSYESYAMDWVSGELSDDYGGYSYLADLMGYPPIAAGVKDDMPSNVQEALVSLYEDMGASFIVAHKFGSINLGDTIYGVPYRPETAELKLFELSYDEAVEALEELLSRKKVGDAPIVINLKNHDKDFFADDSAWVSIYGYGNPKPPYKLNRYSDRVNLLSEAEQNDIWEKYEALLEYISEHESLTLVNLQDLSELL